MRSAKVAAIKLRYVRNKRGNLFWEPTPTMRALGFLPKPLGPDAPPAWAEAQSLYENWLRARDGSETFTVEETYPPGSLGEYYRLFKAKSKAWRKKALRTKEDYERAWKHIGPHLGRKTITKISVTDIEDFEEVLDTTLSPSERYRVMKCLRALFADAIVRLRLNIKSPALAVANPQPQGRSQIWLGSEIQKLVAGAYELEMDGMAVAIMIAWDTLFAPVDVRTLTKQQLRRDAVGWYLHRSRTKTDREAFGHLTDETAAALQAYLNELGADLLPTAALIRRKSGKAYAQGVSGKNYFAQDFRAVRAHVFPGDQRQFLDIRRSGNVEADAAGADKSTMAELLANSMDSSAFLDATYTPATVSKARQIAVTRKEGRERLAAEVDRVSGRSNRRA
ncbi:MAG: hypothetical protein U1E18_00705 [Brevundimonas sp.]|uniref:hypothetical protein n=1 Tax=Brevundimonas sp. TaxID=1871086 RepID=UPI002ABAC837|nr:hypothetical protein [Brevundimonas sp.]MDZ4108104.1 hypothetical protein [Brevundimonas sp.]